MKLSTSQKILLTFLFKIIMGGILLHIFGYTNPESRKLINSMFTAVSAVCVTGLSVLDVGRELNNVGQWILICLVQLGGIGIFAFSNWIMLSISGSLSTKESMLIGDMLGSNRGFSPSFILKSTLIYTFGLEILGMILLFFKFITLYPMDTAIKYSVFHAISAFCNAGFTMYPDSLTSFSNEWYINIVISILVLLGSIGFLVSADVGASIYALIKKKRRKLLLHTKVILLYTLGIIVVSTVTILIFEIENSRMNPELDVRIFESLFIAVTSRTAGFNQLDIGSLTNMSLILICFIMFIGASPGSTAGGIKITTFAILCGMLKSQLNNRKDVEIMSRRIPSRTVSKAMSITVLYGLSVFIALACLQFSELTHVQSEITRGAFIDQLFEVVSALSTVGLSTGITKDLSDPGLMVIMSCMFIGRLGALLIIASVIGSKKSLDYRYPDASILVG